MSIHRRAARRDDNEREILDALQRLGFRVIQLSHPGIPDLLVLNPRTAMLRLLEVKRPGGKLTPAQVRRSGCWPVHIVHNPAEAIEAMREPRWSAEGPT